MKLLTRMRLIHWYYFDQETIPFGKMNFLTGKNGSGKSTILDAMQLVLYGDTSGTYFNKAANGKSKRTLTGYLHGDVGEDEEQGILYLRNGRFTSYIALEFFDDKKDTYFTAGCVFDVYSVQDIQRRFFAYDGALPDHGFAPQGLPMDISQLRQFLNEQYKNHSFITDVGRDFAVELRGKLGGLRERFAPLMKKAISFDPDVEIQAFISDFVCDTQQTVDVSQMQENIRCYKQLEGEAAVLQDKLQQLERIDKVFALYRNSQDQVQQYDYLLKRADLAMAQSDLHISEKNRDVLTGETESLVTKIESEYQRKLTLQIQCDDLRAQLKSNQVAQAIETLETNIKGVEGEIQTREQTFAKSRERFRGVVTQWQTDAERLAAEGKSLPSHGIDPCLRSQLDDVIAQGDGFLGNLCKPTALSHGRILEIGEAGLSQWSQQATTLAQQAIGLRASFQDAQAKLRPRQTELETERATLRKGVYQFPSEVLALQRAIQSRFQRNGQVGDVTIVAQVTEIRSDRWRNVIEGYLHTQKFHLVVAPELYATALQVYNAVKREQKLYGIGLVHIAKMADKHPVAQAGSLAEEVETENPFVRIFLDYTLGWVKKCDSLTDLEHHAAAVTDDGMLYRGFVTTALHPKRWEKPAIGQGAITRRLATVEQELETVSHAMAGHQQAQTALSHVVNFPTLGAWEIAGGVDAAGKMEGVSALREELAQLRKSRSEVDESAIHAMEAHLRTLSESLHEVESSWMGHRDQLTTKKEQLRACVEETMPKQEVAVAQRESALSGFTADWVAETGAPRYEHELKSQGGDKQIAEMCPKKLNRAQNARDNQWQDVVALRQDYNRQYEMGLDVKAADNAAFADLWQELGENKLPEYLTRIQDTKTRAFEQFQEDFLSRLEHNIKDAQLQIEELNHALRGNDFGEDSYRFLALPRAEYKRYYDMIVDPMKLEGGYNLFSAQFNNKYKAEIGELFALITNEGGGGDSTDYEKRVREFTDYRTYLTFDLEVTNTQGRHQRLSKNMQKKSGGETQTPFYLAVVASFAQLYRLGRDKTEKSARLIVFDEAFSKMDPQRVAQAMALLRKFGFQAILSSPMDKASGIVPYVDSSICVLRDGNNTQVCAFDAAMMEELAEDVG